MQRWWLRNGRIELDDCRRTKRGEEAVHRWRHIVRRRVLRRIEKDAAIDDRHDLEHVVEEELDIRKKGLGRDLAAGGRQKGLGWRDGAAWWFDAGGGRGGRFGGAGEHGVGVRVRGPCCLGSTGLVVVAVVVAGFVADEWRADRIGEGMLLLLMGMVPHGWERLVCVLRGGCVGAVVLLMLLSRLRLRVGTRLRATVLLVPAPVPKVRLRMLR